MFTSRLFIFINLIQIILNQEWEKDNQDVWQKKGSSLLCHKVKYIFQKRRNFYIHHRHGYTYNNIPSGLRIRNDLFRIRIRIFYFWIADPDPASAPDPDPARVFKLIKLTKKNLEKLIYLFQYYLQFWKLLFKFSSINFPFPSSFPLWQSNKNLFNFCRTPTDWPCWQAVTWSSTGWLRPLPDLQTSAEK